MTIALILYAILCPCASYILVKKKLTPWSGGVFLVMGDDSLVQVDWSRFESNIPTKSIIKGVFIAGARANMAPEVSFRRFLRNKDARLTKEMVSYCQYETDNGVYQIYCDPMDGSRFDFFMLDVFAPYPWKGHKSTSKDNDYLNYVMIHFRDE